MRKARPLIFLVSWANAQELVNALGIICNDTCCRQAFVKVTAAASRVAPRWIFCRKHNICRLWRLGVKQGWSHKAMKPKKPTPQVGNEAQTGPQVVVLCDTNGPRTRATAERCCQLSLLWSLSLTKSTQPVQVGSRNACGWECGCNVARGHGKGMTLTWYLWIRVFSWLLLVTRRCVPGCENGADTAIQLKCALLKWCLGVSRSKCHLIEQPGLSVLIDNWIALPFARYSNATTVTMLSGVLSMPARQNLLFAQQHAKLYVLLPAACA